MTTKSTGNKLLLLVASVGMLATTSLPAIADTLRVKIDGSGDFTRIQDAVDAAQSGDQINIEPGIYVENVSLPDKELLIVGTEGEASTTLRPENDGQPVINVVASFTTDVTIRGLTIDGNGGGGVLSSAGIISQGTRLRVEDCTIRNNGDVLSDGGGIHLSTPGRTDIVNVLFQDNLARNGGGLFVLNGVDDMRVKVSNSTFEGNTGDVNGGGMWTEFAEVLVTGCDFHGNTASEGGGLYVGPHPPFDVTVRGTLFQSNSAIGDGGGVLVESMVFCEDEEWDFIYDEFIVAIADTNCVALLAYPTFEDCIVEDNDSGFNGGGYALRHHARATIKETVIQRNEALVGGGGISLCESKVDVVNTRIRRNTADQFGGGLMATTNSKAKVTKSRIISNSSVHGGGLYADFGARMIVKNSKLIKNAASGNGGGIGFFNARIDVHGGLLKKNTAVDRGGGAYLQATNFDFIDVNIQKNFGKEGGGILLKSSTGRIRGCSIRQNGRYGVHNKGSALGLKNSSLCSNVSKDIKGRFDDQGGNSICKH